MKTTRLVAAVLLVGLSTACGATTGDNPLPGGSASGSASVDAPSPTRTTPTGSGPASSTGSATATPSQAATPSPAATPGPVAAELPRGGRTLFPRYRLVGYSGRTGATTLGRLGTGPLDQRVQEMEKRAQPYRAGREILPVVEVIATVVQGSAGPDGKYRVRMTDEQVKPYLKAARAHKALLLLNIQPGRSEFLPEVKAYARWLKEPDVGVALDPEWAMDANQVPGRAYGHTTGAELDQVSRYLSDVVKSNDLPEKVMVYHQVASSVVRGESALKDHRGVAVVKSVDGLGPPGPKINTYRVVNQSTPEYVHAGFKLFYTEDRRNHGRLMTPKEVLALKPRPEYVLYE